MKNEELFNHLSAVSRPQNLHDSRRMAPLKPEHDQKTVVAMTRDKGDDAVIMISKAKK